MDRKKLQKIGKLHPRALIAGGAGYLGTHLSKVLLNSGFEVWVLDDFSSGKSEAFSALCSNENFHFWTADINKNFPEEVEESSIDFIFHFARLELRDKRSSQPLSTLITNATGTKNLLDLAKRKSARFLLGSSIGVGRNFPENSSSNPLLEAKRFAEALVEEYRDEFNLNARVVRLAEVYGPGMDFSSSGSLGRMIKELLEKQEITVYGEGLRKEYYVYIDDAVNGVCAAMFSQPQGNWRFVVAPLEPITTLELAYKIRDASALRIKITFTNAPEPYALSLRGPELQNSRPPSWQIRWDLEKGIENIIDYVREHADASVPPGSAKKEEKEGKKDAFKVGGSRGLQEKGRSFLGQVWKWLKRRGLGFLLALTTLFLVLAIPLGQFMFYQKRAESQIARANSHFNKVELDNALQASFNAQKSIEASQRGLRWVSWIFTLVGNQSGYGARNQYLRTLKYLSQYIYYSAESFSPLESALESQHVPASSNAYNSARAALVRAKQMILMIEAEITSSSGRSMPNPFDTAWEPYINQSKNRLVVIQQFLGDPSSYFLPVLRQQLVRYGWVL
ncbi:MAG: NAD-dependent epimerase/dehydratase family protein [Patescibacteria group bacterium]|nr:NAD-dependent epimerase/dehydratase family protein [Patescibacteria group bacterium]